MGQQNEEPALISTFYIGDALFGIDALEVQEVIPLGNLTPVHHAPETISGIINLRGQIVTIMNLAARLGMETNADESMGHILIAAWQGENVGLLVDRVADVVPAEMDDLAPIPANISAAQQRFLKGVCVADQRLVAVLDIDVVLGEEIDEITSSGR
jgi:purine-binding chemotaxis protein CheW